MKVPAQKNRKKIKKERQTNNKVGIRTMRRQGMKVQQLKISWKLTEKTNLR